MILRTILGWLTGDVLGKLTDAYVASKTSAVESERVKADVLGQMIQAESAARAAATQVRLSTAGFWEMRLITAIIAGCFTLHLLLVTLDTCFVFGWGIPRYPEPFSEYEGTVLLSFFGIYTGSKAINAIAAAFIGRR